VVKDVGVEVEGGGVEVEVGVVGRSRLTDALKEEGTAAVTADCSRETIEDGSATVVNAEDPGEINQVPAKMKAVIANAPTTTLVWRTSRHDVGWDCRRVGGMPSWPLKLPDDIGDRQR
jgi:hypothetical protein